jgi:nucleoside-diphosphate kinase
MTNNIPKNLETNKQRTLVMIKPDGIQRSLIGEIIIRYERTGLKLIGMKMIVPEASTIEKHYTVNPEWLYNVGTKSIEAYRKKGITPPSENPIDIGKATLERLKSYMTSGPVICMCWEGMNAIGVIRKITGGTEPLTSDVGTIRGDFTIDSYEIADTTNRSVRNLIHASGNIEEAQKEIELWFKKEELQKYKLFNEVVLYDTNLDGILE